MSSTAVKISSELADAARAAAELAHRSMAGQIEYWAAIGKQMEPHFTSGTIAAIKAAPSIGAIEDEVERTNILAKIAAFQNLSAESRRSALGLGEKIIIEPDSTRPGKFIRILPGGKRENGSLSGRTFIPDE